MGNVLSNSTFSSGYNPDDNNLKTYTSVDQIIPAGSDKTNVDLMVIYDAIPDNSVLIFEPSGGSGFYPNPGIKEVMDTIVTIKKGVGFAECTSVDPDTGKILYSTIKSGSGFSPWSTKFLPLDGSGYMTGNLSITKDAPTIWLTNQNDTHNNQALIQMYNDTLSLYSRNAKSDGNNQRAIAIQNSANGTTLSSAVRIIDKVDGTATYYKLYGEHNKPTPADIGAVNKAGDTMTGGLVMKDLRLTDGATTRVVAQIFDDDNGSTNYGSELVIGAAGNTFIGGGESAANLRTALKSAVGTNEAYAATGEHTYISADGQIMLSANCNTIGNRKTVRITTAGAVVVPNNTDYTTAKARNIKASTTDLTAGTSALSNGDIYLVYE